MGFVSNRISIEIEWGHCDPAGIVFNPRFFEFFDTGTWILLQNALDVSREKLSARFGINIPLVEAGANFIAPLKFGDSAELVSTLIAVRRSSFDVQHQIYKGGKVAVDGLETRVWAGAHPDDPARMRAVPIPDEVLTRLKNGQRS
jgi:4-hydroxybenzoyl-CoA thioesterase